MNDYNKSVSDMVWSIRGIAIVLVAMCHSPSPEFPVFDTIRSIVGVIGVPVFFVCSGYFLKEKTSKEFFCDMAKKIIVPWAIWGGITYLWAIHCGVGGTVTGLMKWCVGYGTWLYFIPMYICSLCFVRFAGRHENALTTFVFVTVISVLLVGVGCMPFNGFSYINPANWVGFVALGRLIKIKDLKMINRDVKILFISLVLLSALMVVVIWYMGIPYEMHYFTIFSILIEVTGMIFFAQISYLLPFSILKKIGQNTFFIFFTHMQFGIGYIAQWTEALFGNDPVMCNIIMLFKPCLAVLLVYIVLLVIKWLLLVFHLDKYKWMIGIR